jgi:pSer/pThr/pTyr-binding forkhead associated (FHA) protein
MATGDDFSARLIGADGTAYDLSGEQTLGRSNDADITIPDPKISRKHAQFRVVGQQVIVEDLGSANGTRVNQRRIEGPAILFSGDVVSFDTVDLSVELTGVEEDDEATMVAGLDEDATMVNLPPEVKSEPEPAPEPAPEPESAPEPEPTPEPPPPTPPPPPPPEPVAAAPEVPSSWVNEGTGEETRVLSSEDAAAAASLMVEVDAASDLPHLVIIGDSGPQQVMELEPSGGPEDVWEIGREDSCQIVIDEEGVSGRHAQLIHQGGRWRLVNLVAVNGIYVNGKKRPNAYLSDDDKIRMGLATIVFKAGNSSIASASGAAPSSATGKASADGGKSPTMLIAAGVIALAIVAAAAWFLLG